MKRAILLLSVTLGLSNWSDGQILLDSTLNSSTKKILLSAPNSFAIGSYGEAHFNQPIVDGQISNGEADLHRIVLFMGYKFKKNFQFFSEVEFEHIHELSVEQAFINYRFSSAFNLKAGVILIPMGVVNEFHEPTLFNGVERPEVDKYILPSTWSEMGFGSHGIIKRARLQYQLYVVNGFNGYNGGATLNGKNGLRSGRQGGGETIFRTPSLTGKLIFFGVNGLKLGVSGYYGNTESSKYDGLDRSDDISRKIADSSSVGISMGSVNLQYNVGKWSFTGIGAIGAISNTEAYNSFGSTNLANGVMGYYGELAYKLSIKKGDIYPMLKPFIRYENFDTHYSVDNSITRNKNYHREVLTTGLGYFISPGAVIKADFQWRKTEADPRPDNVINVGFGYWF